MNHDIDRTQFGYANESEYYGADSGGSVFHEDEQVGLASQLMELNSEQELEYFLGDLLSTAAKVAGKFLGSPTGLALGSSLKDVAKKFLPMAGQALADYVGGSGGGQIGETLGEAADGLFEAEIEEREWEAANTFVKLAGEAAKNAAEAPPGADPHAVAQRAVAEAVKVHAPGLMPSLSDQGHAPGGCSCRHGGNGGQTSGGCSCQHHGGKRHHSGQWFRNGRQITLVGV